MAPGFCCYGNTPAIPIIYRKAKVWPDCYCCCIAVMLHKSLKHCDLFGILTVSK